MNLQARTRNRSLLGASAAALVTPRVVFANAAVGHGPHGGAEAPPTSARRLPAYFINEGVGGCFKDKTLCGVQYDPCALEVPRPSTESDAIPEHRGDYTGLVGRADDDAPGEQARYAVDGDAVHRQAGELVGESALPHDAPSLSLEKASDEEEEDAVVLGPSGLPGDIVASKRLPKRLRPGDWLYFTRMGAYTTSVASVTSSAKLASSFCYVASNPAGPQWVP